MFLLSILSSNGEHLLYLLNEVSRDPASTVCSNHQANRMAHYSGSYGSSGSSLHHMLFEE